MPSIWPRASSRQASSIGAPVHAELQARRTRVEDQRVVVHGSSRWFSAAPAGARARPEQPRRNWRSAIARCRPGSVRITGTRAPSTRPALSALARKLSILRHHVAGLEIGRQQDVRVARDLRRNALRLGRIAADGVVERQRTIQPGRRYRSARDPPSCRAHAASNRWRAFSSSRFRQPPRIATFGRSTPNVRARSIAFWQMSTLSSSVGRDVDRRIRHDQDLVVRRHVHQERMAQAPAGAESGFFGDDRASTSSECRLPFIKSSALPGRTSSTAFAAAARLPASPRSPRHRARCPSPSRPRRSSSPGPPG